MSWALAGRLVSAHSGVLGVAAATRDQGIIRLPHKLCRALSLSGGRNSQAEHAQSTSRRTHSAANDAAQGLAHCVRESCRLCQSGQDVHGLIGRCVGHEEVIVVVAGHHVAGNACLGQCR